MNRNSMLLSGLLTLSIILTACGTTAIPEYEQEETRVSVASTATRELLLTEGAIIPTNTPTTMPSPTVDFAATDAAIATAAFEATSSANYQATVDVLVAQAEATATEQAILDAVPDEPGADDPLFEAVQNASVSSGETLFAMPEGGVPCTSCHSLEPDVRLVGPSQYNLFARTLERLEDGTIDDAGPYSYIYNSIINPNDHIAAGDPPYPENVMPGNYAEILSEEQLYDLVAYMVQIGD